MKLAYLAPEEKRQEIRGYLTGLSDARVIDGFSLYESEGDSFPCRIETSRRLITPIFTIDARMRSYSAQNISADEIKATA